MSELQRATLKYRVFARQECSPRMILICFFTSDSKIYIFSSHCTLSLSNMYVHIDVLRQTKETTQNVSPVLHESRANRFLVSNCSGRDRAETFHSCLSIDLIWNCSNGYDCY